jgi:hypothetical protein
MQTGENEQALRKIIDFIRLLSIGVLLLSGIYAIRANKTDNKSRTATPF